MFIRSAAVELLDMVKLELDAGRRGKPLRFAMDAKAPALPRVHQALD